MAKERKRLRRGPLERLGGLLMAGMFVKGGWDQLKEPGARPKAAAKLGLPNPDQMVRVNGGVMLVSGLMLALGIKPKVAAMLLVGSLVPTTLAGHRFWEIEDPQQRAQQTTHFLKNLGMLGGLLFLLSKHRSVRVPVADD